MVDNLPTRPPVRRRLALAVVLATVLALVASGCDLTRPQGDGPLRFRDPVFDTVTTTANVTYGQAVDQYGVTRTLRFDLYEPAGDTLEDRPLYILAHGGSFSGGDRTSPEIVDQANHFARRGYVVASISYRLSRNGCTVADAACVESIVDAVEDGQSAVRYFRAHADQYGIDTERIAFGGTSAGAILAANVGAGADVPGNGNWPGHSSEVDAAVSFSGAVIFNTYLGPGDAPTLMFHGTTDSLVPYAWALESHQTAKAQGLVNYLVTWEGQGHVPYAQNRTQILDLSGNFLYHRLKVRLIDA